MTQISEAQMDGMKQKLELRNLNYGAWALARVGWSTGRLGTRAKAQAPYFEKNRDWR